MKDESEFAQNPEQITNHSQSELSKPNTSSKDETESINFSPQQSISFLDIPDSESVGVGVEALSKPGTPSNFEIKESRTVILQNESEIKDENADPKNWYRYIGLLLAVLSSLMFSINALIFKILNYSPPLVPATYMFLGTAIFTLPLYLQNRYTARKNVTEDAMTWKTCVILLTRAFTGCSGMLLFFYSLQYLSIGDALVIACSSPVFVFLLAWIFLKESCGLVPVVTIILALFGVGIITRPPLLSGEESFKQDDLIGAGLAFSSMLSIASTLVLMRYLQNVHYSVINLSFGIWGTVQSGGLALCLGRLDFPESISEAVIMSMTGLIFTLGQSFLAVALQLEEAGPVSLLRTSEVIFAFGWQLVFLKVTPDAFSISGAVLIMIGIFTTILRKWIGSLPTTHPARQRFGFLLK